MDVIDRLQTVKDLEGHIARYEFNFNTNTDYDKGYLDGMRFAVRLVRLQEEKNVGQIAINWEV